MMELLVLVFGVFLHLSRHRHRHPTDGRPTSVHSFLNKVHVDAYLAVRVESRFVRLPACLSLHTAKQPARRR